MSPPDPIPRDREDRDMPQLCHYCRKSGKGQMVLFIGEIGGSLRLFVCQACLDRQDRDAAQEEEEGREIDERERNRTTHGP